MRHEILFNTNLISNAIPKAGIMETLAELIYTCIQ